MSSFQCAIFETSYKIYQECFINTESDNNSDHSEKNITKRGRPKVSDKNAEGSTKRRRVSEVRKKIDKNILVAAALPLINLEYQNNNSIENEIKEDKDNTENNDIALAMFLDLRLSKDTYYNLRKYNVRTSGGKLYPPYEKVVEAKKNAIQKTFKLLNQEHTLICNHF